MTLTAADELRHSHLINKDYFWRESVYFNFNDPVNEIGGWIYLWVVPNQPKPSGMLVSFYHGAWPDLEINRKAMEASHHEVIDGNRWLYCYMEDVDHLISQDFDEVELAGLRLHRLEPLKQYALQFSDGGGTKFDLHCRFLMPPYDYADGAHPTPAWMAANRYHRAWRLDGSLIINGRRYQLNCTGDSDHSWGQRHHEEFAKNLFKMFSFQSEERNLTLSVLQQGVGDKEIALGYVALDGRIAAANHVQSTASYDTNGVQSNIELDVTDVLGRRVRACLPQMHSFLGSGSWKNFWGYEGVGRYDVESVGQVNGLSSYFWPARVTPEALRAGKWR